MVSMKILSFESSTNLGGVAAICDGQIVASRESRVQQSHTEFIHQFALEILAECQWSFQDIDAFACGTGPGSFTGIRISANTAKAFCYALGKPLVTVDSLTTLAAQVDDFKLPVFSMINAYKNMVYCAPFEKRTSISELPLFASPAKAIPVRDLGGIIQKDFFIVGDGWDVYKNYFPDEFAKYAQRPERVLDYPCAGTLGLLAEKKAMLGQTMDWNSFVPLYIRASEAEENQRGILLKPLK